MGKWNMNPASQTIAAEREIISCRAEDRLNTLEKRGPAA
jgi:hypothetical protein